MVNTALQCCTPAGCAPHRSPRVLPGEMCFLEHFTPAWEAESLFPGVISVTGGTKGLVAAATISMGMSHPSDFTESPSHAWCARTGGVHFGLS